MPVSRPAAKGAPVAWSSLPTMLALSSVLVLTACASGSGSRGSTTPTPTPSTANEWTWESGSNTTGAIGVYGTLGAAAASNVPGARSNAVSWTDGSGNLWLFGGSGCSSICPSGFLNDLWEFNPSSKEWTWVSGSNTGNMYSNFTAQGVYGIQGVASANNVPGPRGSAVGWTDSSGNLWMFGGEGFISATENGMFNDLWEFNTTTKEWTWVSGSNTINAKGVYGTNGVASTTNTPGARGSNGGGNTVGWGDSSGNLWLFGGEGYDSAGTQGNLNDLWQFNRTAKTWTWVGGSDTANASGVYGTLGVAAASNVPGARSYAVGWTDSSCNFWLYGGGVNGCGTCAGGLGGPSGFDLSDLWEFSPTTKEWTWAAGSNTGGVAPVYGTRGVASASNTPGGRDSAVSWADSNGNLWLFGGFDYDSTIGANGTNEDLNDLWEFSLATKEWTWVGGSNTGNAKGIYGTLGTASTTNVPGARGSGGIAVTWVDSSGNFWLFGGDGCDSTGCNSTGPELNDLWRYQP